MRTIRFGRTNVQVPAVSLGTWGHGGPNVNEGASVGWSGSDDREAKAALVAAYRNGHAEELIGEVWDEVPRDKIFIATKFGYVKGPSGRYYDSKFMRAQ